MTYTLAYDVVTAGPSIFSIVLLTIGIVLSTVAAALVARPQIMRFQAPDTVALTPLPKRPWPFLAFALVFTFVGLGLTDGGRSEHVVVAMREGCTTIEGVVSEYEFSGKGKPREAFSVNGISFEYGEGGGAGAFADTAKFGGPIKPNLPVRLCYYFSEKHKENLILKLETSSETEGTAP